jgi:hypothetical protein
MHENWGAGVGHLAIFIPEHIVTKVALAIYEEWCRSANLIRRGLLWMYLGMCAWARGKTHMNPQLVDLCWPAICSGQILLVHF